MNRPAPNTGPHQRREEASTDAETLDADGLELSSQRLTVNQEPSTSQASVGGSRQRDADGLMEVEYDA